MVVMACLCWHHCELLFEHECRTTAAPLSSSFNSCSQLVVTAQQLQNSAQHAVRSSEQQIGVCEPCECIERIPDELLLHHAEVFCCCFRNRCVSAVNIFVLKFQGVTSFAHFLQTHTHSQLQLQLPHHSLGELAQPTGHSSVSVAAQDALYLPAAHAAASSLSALPSAAISALLLQDGLVRLLPQDPRR